MEKYENHKGPVGSSGCSSADLPAKIFKGWTIKIISICYQVKHILVLIWEKFVICYN